MPVKKNDVHACLCAVTGIDRVVVNLQQILVSWQVDLCKVGGGPELTKIFASSSLQISDFRRDSPCKAQWLPKCTCTFPGH